MSITMTPEYIKAYLRGELPREHAVDPMIEHGEIPTIILPRNDSNVVLHEPTNGYRNV